MFLYIKSGTALFLIITIISTTTITTSLAQVTDFKACIAADSDNCEIHEVRINPCPQSGRHIACEIRRRRPATISFDMTPQFVAESFEARVTWLRDDGQELPLVTLDKEACKYTKCPTESGVKQTYEIDVPIEKKFPMSTYTIKWLLKGSTGQNCCFTTDIKVVR